MPANCTPFQKSLNWCMGTPELPGIRRRIYYISKDQIAAWFCLFFWSEMMNLPLFEGEKFMQNPAFCTKKSQNGLTFLPLNKKCIPLRAIFVKYIFLQIKT